MPTYLHLSKEAGQYWHHRANNFCGGLGKRFFLIPFHKILDTNDLSLTLSPYSPAPYLYQPESEMVLAFFLTSARSLSTDNKKFLLGVHKK